MKRFISLFLLIAVLVTMTACDGAENDPTDALTKTDEQATESTPIVADFFEYTSKPYYLSGDNILAPEDKDANISNPKYSVALYNEDKIKGDFVAELDIALKIPSAKAGIIFNAKKVEGAKYTGYAFIVTQGKVSLNSISVNDTAISVNEIISHAIEYVDLNQTVKLRVECSNKTIRLYFLDDISSDLVPWPEIEINDAEHNGESLLGYIDDGRGSSFGDISIYDTDALYNIGLSGEGPQYINPVSDKSLADPQVIYWEGKYYLYSTSYWRGFKVYESEDLVNWTDMGVCLDGAWDNPGGKFWAPEVSVKDGKFYMVFSNSNDLGIAVSDSPLGPFIAPEKPLLESTIDGHLFFDDDGRVYLYYVSWRSTYGIYGCELDPSLSSVIEGSEKLLLTASLAWERQGERIAEGPAILKHNGTYYLTYSGSHYSSKDYAVGYATSSSPLGKYEKYKGNPVLSRSTTVNGTGHHSFIRVKNTGELFIVYHCHRPTPEYTDRIICIDRVRFSPSKYGIDRLEIYGPTSTPQNYPK